MSPKVSLSALSGAIVLIIIWVVETMTANNVGGGVTFPAPIASAMTVIVMGVVSYLVPDTWNVPLKTKQSE